MALVKHAVLNLWKHSAPYMSDLNFNQTQVYIKSIRIVLKRLICARRMQFNKHPPPRRTLKIDGTATNRRERNHKGTTVTRKEKGTEIRKSNNTIQR